LVSYFCNGVEILHEYLKIILEVEFIVEILQLRSGCFAFNMSDLDSEYQAKVIACIFPRDGRDATVSSQILLR
jgi:hypothetical protein